MKTLLPIKFPGQRFEFLGNPFTRLPLPLLWDERERERDATTRLLECWAALNEFCCSSLRPLLETDAVVVTHGFGLDALLYATACVGTEKENDEAFRLHDGLVKIRLKEQKIAAPVYFITRADATTLDPRMIHAVPELGKVSQRVRRAFIRYEEKTIDDYFRRISNQKTPHYIPADIQVSAMATMVTEEIGRHLKRS